MQWLLPGPSASSGGFERNNGWQRINISSINIRRPTAAAAVENKSK
jgi:hypothetical protein